MRVLHCNWKKLMLFFTCLFYIESCYYDISMYKGDCCIKKIGYGRFSGFEINFGRFIMDNSVRKVYEIDKLPPHGGYHVVKIIIHDIPDLLKTEILEVTPTLKLWTEEKEICSVKAGLSDFYVNKYYGKNYNSFQFHFDNYKKIGKGPESVFTQDSLMGNKCYLSVEFDSVSEKILNGKLYVSMHIIVGGHK